MVNSVAAHHSHFMMTFICSQCWSLWQHHPSSFSSCISGCRTCPQNLWQHVSCHWLRSLKCLNSKWDKATAIHFVGLWPDATWQHNLKLMQVYVLRKLPIHATARSIIARVLLSTSLSRQSRIINTMSVYAILNCHHLNHELYSLYIHL